MVYIGNILYLHQKLTDNNHLVRLLLKSGREINIRMGDNLEKCRGDLKITSHKPSFVQTIILDCAEVEYVLMTEKVDIK